LDHIGFAVPRSSIGAIAKQRVQTSRTCERRNWQERLVKLLDEADELRKLRAQADKRTADLIPALFHEMFSGRQDTALSRVKLGEICERITKGESPGWQGFAYCDDGPVFVTSENVLWGRLDLSEPKHIPGEFHQKLARSALRPNDVLINLVGASIGRCCLVPTNIGQANINQAVACITPGVSIVPVYLCAFLLSKSTQSELHGGKVEAARANISLSDLRELQVSLPSLALQREFTARVSDIRAMEADQATSRRRLDDLFQSMLHRAFNGEL
jgi:type I restriction enzyme S subunit